MADLNVERRYEGTRTNWAWVGLGILLLAVIAWIVYSFMGLGSGPEPVPVDFEQTAPATGTTGAAGGPATQPTTAGQ
jgi:hypothetical protein